MKFVTRREAEKLADDPISFAMMMDPCQLEQVIVAFVSVLNSKKPDRGDQNRDPNTEPNSH